MKVEQIMAEMKAILKASHEEMKAEMKAHQEGMMAIIKTGLEEMKSVAVHEEVPKEEATVKPVRAVKKRHRVWHLAAGCHGKPKEQTQGNGGSQKKLATIHRGMTRHAGVA
jgi:hypothetical protein